MKQKIKSYEDRFKVLIGTKIKSINYCEIKLDEESWNYDTYHSLDYGLEIITEDEKSFYFIWDNEFVQYDVKFREGSISSEFSSESIIGEYHNIDNQKLNEIIGQKINEVKVLWSDVFRGGRTYPESVKIHYHQALIAQLFDLSGTI